MTICEELEELLPAYVLDAVDDRERKRIEAHLPRCTRCTQLVAEYRPVVDLLPYAAKPVEPPADLRFRVLAAATPTAHKPPTTRGAGLSIPAALSGLFRSPALAAITLVLIIALGIWNVMLQNQLAEQAAFEQQVLAELARQRDFVTLMAYADGQPRRLQGTEAASRAAGRLYGELSETALALIVTDMPLLRYDQVYQFWLIDPNGDRTSGGIFRVDEKGRGWLLIRASKPLNQYQGVGITVEPMGGSLKPTGTRMLGTSL